MTRHPSRSTRTSSSRDQTPSRLSRLVRAASFEGFVTIVSSSGTVLMQRLLDGVPQVDERTVSIVTLI
jgi:hypothetical protein